VRFFTNSFVANPTIASYNASAVNFYNASAVNVYNASAVNFYNAMGGLTRFENKNILFYFEKRSMLPTTTLAL
jgi:hypothetical protein